MYAVPPQWTRQAARDRIVLSSPVYDNGERCQITMLPTRSSSQPLAAEAIGTFRSLFRTDPLTSYPSPPPKLAKGTSPQGWEYFMIRKLVGGQEGESRTLGVTLLLAKLDNQTATVVGTSKDFLVSRCFGQLAGDAWPGFFYSFGFRNARANLPQWVIRQQLAGDWITATSSVGLQYTFLANGRYRGAGRTRFSSESATTTQAFFGDGSYSIDGNTLVLTADNQRRSTMFFRLEKVSKDSGQTWGDQLCLLDPGAHGEVCYRKE
jgi:hypothetical protein